MPTSDELLSTSQAAALMRCTPNALTRAVRAGRIRAVTKMPGQTGAYVFRRGDLPGQPMADPQAASAPLPVQAVPA